jgi:hypothetical protein
MGEEWTVEEQLKVDVSVQTDKKSAIVELSI